MRRREFIRLLGSAAVGWPLAARAQPPGRTWRIGVLMNSFEGDPDATRRVMAFQQGLETLGWTLGSDLQIDYGWGAGAVEATRAAASKLLEQAPDVIVTDGGQGLGELRRAARTLPIVFMEIDEPVFYGFVEGLARPGGNMTGFTGLDPTMGAKWLELLNEIAPRVSRIAVMFNPRTAPGAVLFSRSAEAAAPRFAIEMIRAPVYEAADIEAVMTMLAREPGGGLILPIDPFTQLHRKLILELAARYRLPAVSGTRKMAAAGGLVSYGIDLPGQYQQAAGYVDRILRGEKPAELPVRMPTAFELVINLKTAKALGLELPGSILQHADLLID
jgi:putative ABC transport system substrate-binding protein